MPADSRIDNHERRITSLESDMSDVKVTVAEISVKLDAADGRADERFTALSTSQIELKEIIQARDREAREYRDKRETLETQADIERARWIRSLIDPKTVMILLAIILSMLGMRATDIQDMAEIIGTPIPKVLNEDAPHRR